MTIAMLALAGFPATAGFFGKIYLIDAAVDNGYAWLGVVIVLGSAISLAYYLRVVAAVWMRSPSEAPARPPADAGRRGRRSPAGRAEADAARRDGWSQPEVLFVAILCAAATVVFGIYPDPLIERRPRRGRRADLAGQLISAGASATPANCGWVGRRDSRRTAVPGAVCTHVACNRRQRPRSHLP